MRSFSNNDNPHSYAPLGFLFVLLLAGLMTLSLGGLHFANAQSAGWDEPVNISLSAGDSMFPSIVSDAAGHLHVVWCESDPEREATCNSINYASFNGQTWSQPVDIIFAGANEVSTSPALAIDSSGILHMAWVGGASDRLLYSQTYAPSAGSARNWTTPETVGFLAPLTLLPDIAVDRDDGIHVVYAVAQGEGSGIFHTRSLNGGTEWTQPVPVFSNATVDRTVNEPRLAVDSNRGIHVVWGEAGYPDTFPPLGLRYARSLNGGDTWEELRFIPGPYSASGLLASNSLDVHHVWSGTTTDRYKFHSRSSDGGENWSTPIRTSEVGGQQGWPALATDAAGNVHLLQVTGVNEGTLTYQMWEDGRWSTPISVLDRRPGSPNHATNADAVVALGNQLHGVVSDVVETPPGSGNWQFDVFYLHKSLNDVPQNEPQPLPTPMALANPDALPTSSPQPVVAGEPSPASPSVALSNSAPTSETAMLSPLLAGALSAGLVVVVISVVSIMRRRR